MKEHSVFALPGEYGDFKLVRIGNKVGLRDKSGNLVCPIKYSVIYRFVDGLAIVKIKLGHEQYQWGFINQKGEERLFLGDYQAIIVLNRKVIAVKCWGHWGLIDKLENFICKFKYDECPGAYNNGFSKVKCGGFYAFIDENGRQICATQYTDVENFDEYGQVDVKRSGCWYRMNKKGVELKSGRKKC